MNIINFNEQLLQKSKYRLSFGNRGLKFGDSVFETLKVLKNRILFGEDHYFRLMSAMRICRMEIPSTFTPEYLRKQILKTIKANAIESISRVRITIFRKNGGLYTPSTNDIDFIIEVGSLTDYFYTINDKPYRVDLFKDHYKNTGLLDTIKTNNCMVNVLAGIYAKENELDNCLLLNHNKHLAESIHSNVFLVQGNQIKTPSLEEGAIKGVLRDNLIKTIENSQEYTLKQEKISPFELQRADEVFLTNVIIGIQPITHYRKKTYKTEIAKILLKKLNAQIALFK